MSAIERYIWIAAVVISGALGAWGTAEYKNAKFDKLIADQQVQAQQILAEETAKNVALEKKWTSYARTIDDDYQKQITELRARRNVANGVRLFDPGTRESSCGPSTGKDGTGDVKEETAPRELSAELSAFLRNEAERADEISAYANACFAFVSQK